MDARILAKLTREILHAFNFPDNRVFGEMFRKGGSALIRLSHI